MARHKSFRQKTTEADRLGKPLLDQLGKLCSDGNIPDGIVAGAQDCLGKAGDLLIAPLVKDTVCDFQDPRREGLIMENRIRDGVHFRERARQQRDYLDGGLTDDGKRSSRQDRGERCAQVSRIRGHVPILSVEGGKKLSPGLTFSLLLFERALSVSLPAPLKHRTGTLPPG